MADVNAKMTLVNSDVGTGSAEYPEEEWLALSGIQHFAFCKRQWALIHIEQLWSDNTLTTSGDIEHKRAHDYLSSEKRGDLLVLRDLRVFSRYLGVVGDCDVVEFNKSVNGISLVGRPDRWQPYPVEYKHGSSKVNDADRLQLCGEAMCLEEMLACEIGEGALFYQRTKRRERVVFTAGLRATVVEDFRQMHDLFMRGYTPRVHPGRGCRSCSLRNLCLPELLDMRSARSYMDQVLADDGEEVG